MQTIFLYCIALKYLYSAPQQPWANRGAFGSTIRLVLWWHCVDDDDSDDDDHKTDVTLISDDSLLHTEVMNILPVVQNVMAMAIDMEKDVQFRIFLLSPDLQGLDYGKTEV